MASYFSEVSFFLNASYFLHLFDKKIKRNIVKYYYYLK